VEEERLDLLAGSLRADSSDARTLIEALATKLEAALPNQTLVERKATRPFSRTKRVERIAISLGEHSYKLSMIGGSATATRSKAVGGITIRNEDLSLDEWLSNLTAALGAEAKRSETARIALERLLS
jgi:hypothetical protein